MQAYPSHSKYVSLGIAQFAKEGSRLSEIRTETEREYWRRINAVIDYIEDHLNSDLDLDLEHLAGVASFSKYHFHRIFRAITGETVNDYIRRQRLTRAAHYLFYNRRDSIGEVALRSGFSSQANFAKAFKKYFGLSPSEVRELDDVSKIGKPISKDGKASGKTNGEVAFHNSTLKQQLNSTRNAAMNVEVKNMPERNVAYIRHIGPYEDQGISRAWENLCAWAGPRMLLGAGTEFLGISHDNPDVTPHEKCRYDACITIPGGTAVEGDIGSKTLEAGQYAVYHCEIENMDFKTHWDRFAGQWLPSSGYQPADGPVFEIYHQTADQHPEGKMIVDLCMPVKPL